jgi:hypothetical protein
VNEDETYRALIRVDFETLYAKVNALNPTEFRAVYYSAAEKAVYFNKFGWTTAEFETECQKRRTWDR